MAPPIGCLAESAVRSGDLPSRHALDHDVSVCIANWNCRDILRACLHSLLRQAQGVSLEVIVVDNASSDGAADMVACEFPEARLIRNPCNVGFARANNQAARVARGRLLFFLNNDTSVPPHTLVNLMHFLDAHREVILLGPRLRDGRGKVQVSYRKQPTITSFLHRTLLLRCTGLFRGRYRTYRREALFPGAADVAQPVEVLMGAALLTRRRTFLEMGAWDEDFTFGGEDLELCFRARQRGQVIYFPGATITHYGRVSTRRNIHFASTRIPVGFVQFFRKTGASRAALFGYKLAVTLDVPFQLLIKGGQYVWRRLRGRQHKADQSLAIVRGVLPFLTTGLWRFWRA